MIQDIEPHIYKNEYRPVPPGKDALILAYKGRKILLKDDPEGVPRILYPTFSELEAYVPDIYSIVGYILICSAGVGVFLWENKKQRI